MYELTTNKDNIEVIKKRNEAIKICGEIGFDYGTAYNSCDDNDKCPYAFDCYNTDDCLASK